MKKFLSSLIIFSLLASSCGCATETKEPPINSNENEPVISEKITEAPPVSQTAPLSFTAPDGGTLFLNEATGVTYNLAYISYAAQDGIIMVKEGDRLDNGLRVRTAYSDFQQEEEGYSLANSWAAFEGTLTLKGVLETTVSMDGTEGELFFYPETDDVPYQPNGTPRYYLGNINIDKELCETVSGVISSETKTVKLEVVVDNIVTNASYVSSGKNDKARLLKISISDN